MHEGGADRDGGGDAKTDNGGSNDNLFKSADDFYKYIGDKVTAFSGSTTKIQDFKNSLAQRGIRIITDESNFIIHVEATVQQTKRTIEAYVSIIDSGASTAPLPKGAASPAATASPTATPPPGSNATTDNTIEKSNLKITQLRFL